MTARLVAIAGRKGGVGKTTLALGLAGCYARAGARVLLLDLDPQASATITLGRAPDGAHLLAMLEGRAAPAPVSLPLLDLLPGGQSLATLVPVRPLRESLAGLPADVVLVDCAPGHVTLDSWAMAAADVVLVATEAAPMALAGAARTLADARSLSPAPRCALVLGRVDTRRASDRLAPDLLAGALGATVLAVRQDAQLAASLAAGALGPAVGRAAADLAAIVDWIGKES